MSDLQTRILGYLRDHPRAADTAEGIAEWWLGGADGGSPDLAHVELELRSLVATGLMIRTRKLDGGFVYSLADRPTVGPNAD